MHKLLVLLIAFISLFRAPSYGEVIDKVSSSVVRITGEKDVETFFGPMHVRYTCSGEVISPNHVLTAGHCAGDKMLADGEPARVVKVDKYFDLALLEAKTNKPYLEFSTNKVERFQPLTAIGYGWALNRLMVVSVKAFLFNVVLPDSITDEQKAPGMLVQGDYVGGMSGGPVVDEFGRMVGIVQGGGDGVGYGVQVQTISVFLLGT